MLKRLAAIYVFLVPRLSILSRLVPDKIHLKIMFYEVMGRRLDLDSPASFNEKLQWLKIHDRNPRYIDMVDKLKVKEWVVETIGEEYVPKVLGVWKNPQEINIQNLPNQFVLKTNHDCGGVSICVDKGAYDLDSARQFLQSHLRRNYFWGCREWPYKNVEPLVFAEEYIVPGNTGEIVDYKFMCFGGAVKSIFTCTNRTCGDLRVDFFDREWQHLSFERHYKNADVTPLKPVHLKQMIRAAEQLAAGLPFVRVDFYETDNRVYFGEMTFYPGAGFEEFDPPEWDETLGSWIDLSLVSGH